jgi:hypothetical protein
VFAGPLYAPPQPPQSDRIVISHFQVALLISAYRAHTAEASPLTQQTSADLGLSLTSVTLDDVGAHFPDGATLSWTDARPHRRA